MGQTAFGLLVWFISPMPFENPKSIQKCCTTDTSRTCLKNGAFLKAILRAYWHTKKNAYIIYIYIYFNKVLPLPSEIVKRVGEEHDVQRYCVLDCCLNTLGIVGGAIPRTSSWAETFAYYG